ncbi:hypothetical protein EIN_093530 [Entamoeba invadens IP1]|uniref:DWNN domain-containing protein n=1 Tax=Entamoeba invadens IP1 TaxID=370355 RepID=A0A0A1U5U1_ENTIV|nr:hypothetical protein EIN_093530 [Entamoeba invadens IP1]ELP87196.1 hypothetical protein EIN_093530 [Entamoeba invadens IP1]|eukprot:XP_004253967.1 hypothetical protein EIN_093530 [Entamoeba invadens IP1]
MATRGVVMYHFEVSKRNDKKISFFGRSITASEVINEIIKQRGDSSDKDELHIYDVQTNQEYIGGDRITKNTFLCVKRMPRIARPMQKKRASDKKKVEVKEPSKEVVEVSKEDVEQLKAEGEKKRILNERQSLLCKCGNLLIGAVFVFCCGETICENCLAKGTCPYCDKQISLEECSPKQDIRDAVDEFLKTYPEYVLVEQN